MAFHGDLFSYPLPELLQWLDGSRKTGTLQVGWEAGERKLFVRDGQVVATAGGGLRERIARVLEVGQVASGQKVLEAMRAMEPSSPEQAFAARGLDVHAAMELAIEELYAALADLTQASRGQFHWTEDPDCAGDEWVPADIALRHLLFESLRWVDERPDIERALPLDSMVVRAKSSPEPGLPLFQRILLVACREGQSLGRLRLQLSVTRSAVTRRVFELLRARRVEVDGAPQIDADPVAEMLEKGAVLLRQRQFEAAGLLFATLLQGDPTDRRVREFAVRVEREHVAELYRELTPIAVPVLVDDAEALARLRPDERQVASLVNGRWDVATIVLASPSRELETLKCLVKLQRTGQLRLYG